MSREVWKDVASAPGWQASSHGRIRKFSVFAMPRGGVRQSYVAATCGTFDTKKQRYKQSVNGRTRWVAPMICEAFNGHRPSPAHQCMHLDEDSTNNSATNLAWGTRAENYNAPQFINGCSERVRHMWDAQKDDRRNAKVTEADVRAIRTATGTLAVIAAAFGISRSAVSMIRSRKTWGHVE